MSRANLKLWLPLAFLLFTVSCEINDRVIYLELDHASDLDNESSIHLSGYEVGKVIELSITPKGKIIAKLNFDEALEIPDDSRFRVENLNLIGTRRVDLVFGQSTGLLNWGDTVSGTVEHIGLEMDSFLLKATNLYDMVSTLTGLVDTLRHVKANMQVNDTLTVQKEAAIQACFDQEEWLSYFSEDYAQKDPPLVILDNGKVPPRLNLTMYGKRIPVVPENERPGDNFLTFWKFDFTIDHADVHIAFPYDGMSFEVELESEHGQWMVVQKKMSHAIQPPSS